MRSHSLIANCFHLDFLQPRKCSLLSSVSPNHRISFQLMVFGCKEVRKYGFPFPSKHRPIRVMAMDEGFWDNSFLDDPGANEEIVEYFLSSSEGEDSDGEVTLQPITDVDLPTKREQFCYDDAITVAAHRLSLLGKERKKNRLKYGFLNNMGLIIFLVVLLVLVDWGAWRIVRLPLPPFYLTRPFFLSAILVSCAGYICVPWLRGLKFRSIVQKEGTSRHSSKKKTPPMGGIFLVPVGIVVAEFMVGFSSIEVSGAAAATLAFAAIGFYSDYLSLVKNYSKGSSPWMRVLLEVAVGMSFSFWLYATTISSPYSMYTFLKMVVPLPAPVGLVCLEKIYLLLTSCCFVSMGNGVNLTDGIDGLVGGIAALAFVGMSIAVLPLCSDLAVFGASMAGACVGFLLHNRYKASVLMGETGALALGGALAAMAACTGMFFPLFISSGIFFLEAVSVVMQVSFFKTTKRLLGTGQCLFRMAPLHHHLKLSGLKEPIIVAGAYVVSCMLALCAGYVGLISV